MLGLIIFLVGILLGCIMGYAMGIESILEAHRKQIIDNILKDVKEIEDRLEEIKTI